MSCTRELTPWSFDLNVTSSVEGSVWDPQWHPCTGVSSVDLLADVRNIVATGGGSPGVSLLPALQLAAVRADRPDAGAAVSTGSPITTVGLTHYQESVSTSGKFWMRRGFAFKLTGLGALCATASVTLHTSFRSCGRVFPAREIVVNPVLDATVESWCPIAGPFPIAGLDKAKAAIVGIDNTSADLRFALGFRAFNDPMARGAWTTIFGFVQPNPTTGSFDVNTTEQGFAGITLANFQWGELALGVKTNSGSSQPRVVFQVIPAVKYT